MSTPDESGLDQIDEVLAALAEPMRRRVLDSVAAHGETTATGLAGELPVSRQAVVQHLTVLERTGLVSSRRSGRERRYRVEPRRLAATAHWMARVAAAWDARLDTIRLLAEGGGGPQSGGASPGSGDASPPGAGEADQGTG